MAISKYIANTAWADLVSFRRQPLLGVILDSLEQLSEEDTNRLRSLIYRISRDDRLVEADTTERAATNLSLFADELHRIGALI
jgi:hypothetical protein